MKIYQLEVALTSYFRLSNRFDFRLSWERGNFNSKFLVHKQSEQNDVSINIRIGNWRFDQSVISYRAKLGGKKKKKKKILETRHFAGFRRLKYNM